MSEPHEKPESPKVKIVETSLHKKRNSVGFHFHVAHPRARNSGEGHITYGSITVRHGAMANTRSLKAKIEADSKRFHELKADLERTEYFSKGTLLARMIKCGKPKCPCAADPKKRHGPYPRFLAYLASPQDYLSHWRARA